MKRLMTLALLALLAFPAASYAITEQEAKDEAEAWILARWDAIKSRIQQCVQEGDERLCHTAWSASNLCETDINAPALCSNPQDDPGREVTTDCGTCFNGQGTFSGAGIGMPNNAPLIASINIAKGPTGRSEQVMVRINYEGVIWERGWGRRDLPDYDWREVE